MYKIHLFRIAASLVLCVMIGACSTNPKQSVAPIGFKVGEAKFNLLSTKLQLNHGHGAPGDITIFASQDEMQETLNGLVKVKMAEARLIAPQSNFAIEIFVNYDRVYNIGGKALNKPKVSYVTKIYRDGVLVRTRESGTFTTKFPGLKDAAVNFEIAAFKWDKEDEPKDLEVIASTIISDLQKIGD